MVREASHIDFVHEKRHMDVGGRGGGLALGRFSVKIVENFDSLLKIFNVLKLSIQSIQNPAFKCICMLIVRSWSRANCTFMLLYTTLNPKACKINNASGASAESKKVRDVSKGGVGGGIPEKRPYDVSRGQNRYVALPLVEVSIHGAKY